MFKRSVFNQIIHIIRSHSFHKMSLKEKQAINKFEHVRQFEEHQTLLKNCWVVVRVDGKGFHKFADKHNFFKPNDSRALSLMNRCGQAVMEEFMDVVLAYGQSDEYSFILKKEADVYSRRAHKLVSTITSLFTSSYVFYWSKFFDNEKLLYPPCFDGRAVLYPSDQNLIDYLCWRQADVHINNLYNTTFWNLVLNGNMTNTEAEKYLCGTVSSDKNEILFKKFNINYNNEPTMFKKGTTLLRKAVLDSETNKRRKVIVDISEDMIQDRFWKNHPEILGGKMSSENYEFKDNVITPLVMDQLERKRNCSKKETTETLQHCQGNVDQCQR